MRKPSPGSISQGTMRTCDLLEAFGWELQHITAEPSYVALAKEARERAHYFTWNDLPEGEEVEETEVDRELVDRLFDALNELAPPYCYFGASDGDGSDYGFWPSMDAIEELPHIADPSEVADYLGEDCVFVNDHGNVTVYAADGSIALELV